MDLVIVDCQNDFVDGALGAPNGVEAVEKIVEFLDKTTDLRVFYSSDFHPSNHLSFLSQGGPWPAHCVEGSLGAEIHESFYNTNYPPTTENTFFKGRNPREEEYSAFEARNGYDEKLKDLVGDKVYLVGIASEYCVRETALAFKKHGKEVVVIKDLLGYIVEEDHIKNLEDLEEKGIEIQ